MLQVQQFSSVFFQDLIFFTTSQLHLLTKSNVCRRLLHCVCLLCVHKLMKFTYDVIFYVAFVTHTCVSLFTGIHCVISVVKKNFKIFLSIIPMFLTSLSSPSFATPPISCYSAFYTICHKISDSSSMTLSLLLEEWTLSLEVAVFDLPC